MRNLLKACKITRVANSAVAGTTDVTSSVLDMAGFDGVIYVALLGDVTVNSVLTLTAKENTANSTSTPTPTSITGGATAAYTATATDSDNKALVVDVNRPLRQFQFCILSRTAANAVVDGIIAIQYKAHLKPTVQDVSVLAQAFAVGS
ncbi:MAG TPA: hypothetical protein VF995_11535 [Actinomycetota bacterium]